MLRTIFILSVFLSLKTILESPSLFGQSGIIETRQELESKATDYLLRFMEASDRIHKVGFVAASSGTGVFTLEEPLMGRFGEWNDRRIFFFNRKTETTYRARGQMNRTEVVSARQFSWEETLNVGVRWRHRRGYRQFNPFVGRIVLNPTQDLDPEKRKDQIVDPCYFPIADLDLATAGRAGPSYCQLILQKYDFVKGTKLPNGDLAAVWSNTNGTVATEIVFSAADDFLPVSAIRKVPPGRDRWPPKSVWENGWVYSKIVTSWRRLENGTRVPSLILFQHFGCSPESGHTSDVAMQFRWLIGDEVEAIGPITLETEDWLKPFVGVLLDENYNLIVQDEVRSG